MFCDSLQGWDGSGVEEGLRGRYKLGLAYRVYAYDSLWLIHIIGGPVETDEYCKAHLMCQIVLIVLGLSSVSSPYECLGTIEMNWWGQDGTGMYSVSL